MKPQKKQTGSKVVLTKGKRVSLRCPLTVDSTELEYNYEVGAAQVCLTVENTGGGGVTNDTVESAIVVIRLYDRNGALLPCMKNEYFAKMLRFGEKGLPSGAQITFRLTPDCASGLGAEDVELYISRVRYVDGSVTDYLRGDFFDLPSNAVPLHKKHKKDLSAITATFGDTALYEPEALTEIIWRCTCGEFCESDRCPACNASKTALFDYFKPALPVKKAAVGVSLPKNTDEDPTDAKATEATTEYDAGAVVSASAGALGSADPDKTALGEPSDDQNGADEDGNLAPAPAPEKRDKLKIGLIAAIAGTAVVLAIIVSILVVTLISRASGTADHTTSNTTTTQPPISDDPPVDPNAEKETIVRTYLAQRQYANALGYARANGCDQSLIDEIISTAFEYYTNIAPDTEEALKYAEEMDSAEAVEFIKQYHYDKAMKSGDYLSAIEYARTFAENSATKVTEAADALLQSQLVKTDFNAAFQTATDYPTSTAPSEIVAQAIGYYADKHDYDEAIRFAENISDSAQVTAITTAAIGYYTDQGDFGSAIDYAIGANRTDDIVTLLPSLSETEIAKRMPALFAHLSFEQKQSIHASVLSGDSTLGIVDANGNAYWGTDGAYIAEVGGKTVVSIKCTKRTTVLLFSDGTVAAYGDNAQGQCNVESWQNIVAIDASDTHTVGLTADGTVVATGLNNYLQCDVSELANAAAVSAGGYHTLVLFSDGTVKAIGMTSSGQCNTDDWTDIVMISAGHLHSIGLKADGTAVSAGSSKTGRCDVDEWSKVVRISAGESYTVGLTENGTLLLAGGDSLGDISGMANAICANAGGTSLTVLLSNGMLAVIGETPSNFDYISGFEISTDIFGA